MSTSRVQLALNVADIEAATGFYRDLFGVEPAKRRPGYANFEIADPPLKLVLFENPDAASPLNHLGVEVADTGRRRRGGRAGSTPPGCAHTMTEADRCCHAVQDKVWVDAPDVPLGAWEFYTVLADDPAEGDGTAARVHAARRRDRHRRAAATACGSVTWPPKPWSSRTCRSPSGPPGRSDGIDLRVPPGTTLGVLGHNGAGKTTLIRVLTTLVRPTGPGDGRRDRRVAEPGEVRRRIGVTGQYAGLDDFLTDDGEPRAGRPARWPRAAARGRARRPHRPLRPADLAAAGSASCRAAPAAGSTWPPAWSARRRCCSSTSPPPASTRPPARRCGMSSPSSPPPAPRSCSPPSTWTKPIGWPTRSWSSTTAASPAEEPRPS